MAQELRELVRQGDLEQFEAKCLELLEQQALPLGEVVACLRQLWKEEKVDRIPPLAQTVLENVDLEKKAREALPLAVLAFQASPKDTGLRDTTVDLYRRVYGGTPGFDAVLESSGLTTGRPPRAALRVLDFCLALNVGDTLISRMDDRVVLVEEIDRERGLFTLRRDDRATTIPAREVVREYDRIEPDDFRVLRQLRPDGLVQLIRDDPVKAVIGLLHAHEDLMDADTLKHDLVPTYLSTNEWSKWWTRARNLLKRSPHVVIEGRSPIILQYTPEAVTLEDETWTGIEQAREPTDWLATVQRYLREKRTRGEEADAELLRRAVNHIVENSRKVRDLRPTEALSGALLINRLHEEGVPVDEGDLGLAREVLAATDEPVALIASLKDDAFWKRALEELPAARPQDWPGVVAALFTRAPASQLDTLLDMLRTAQRVEAAQAAIDDALADPVDYPEVLYWLWKGPKQADELRLPADGDLFRLIIDTISALDTTLTPAPEVARAFRTRMKMALALKSFGRARACVRNTSEAAAVTLRRQLDRTEGLGDAARMKLLEELRDTHPMLWVQRMKKVQPWEDKQTIWATVDGIRQKTGERDELVNVKMPENAKRIGEAASHGDLSENSEYKFALEERDFLRARLAQINQDLSLTRQIEPEEVPTDHVGIGSRVRLRKMADGEERVMVLLGPFEADVEQGIFNYRAPACQRVLGSRVGEHVTLTLEGDDHEFEVVAIENALRQPA